MFVVDGIAYAGEPEPILKVVGVRPLDDYCLWLHFSTDETRIFDMKPLLESSGFAQLAGIAVFKQVYLDHGIPTWDEYTDIAPEYIYKRHSNMRGTYLNSPHVSVLSI